MVIIFLLAQDLLLSVSECLSYLVNQIPHLDSLMSLVDVKVESDSLHVDSWYPDWFHVFDILTFFFTSFYNYDASAMCN